MSIIADSVSTLLASVGVLRQEGHKLNCTELVRVKHALRSLHSTVDRADELGAATVEFGEEGVVVSRGPLPAEPTVTLSEDGIEIHAGERMKTAIIRAREAKGYTCRELADLLPISEDLLRSIENGGNYSMGEDLFKALADALDVDYKELQRLMDLDIDSPVRPVWNF